jgi:pyruvate-formate lyase
MAIRMAEYAFLAARQTAQWDIGFARISMPNFSVIYVKKTDKTPRKTTIEISFPNGEIVTYESDNVILEDFTKEYIIENKLFHIFHFILQDMKTK